ncbi:hypothetical protein [Lysobacter gummosus]
MTTCPAAPAKAIRAFCPRRPIVIVAVEPTCNVDTASEDTDALKRIV